MSLYYFRPVLDEVQLPLLTRFQNLSLQFKPNERVSAEVIDTLPSGAAILRVKGSEIEVKTQIPLQKGMQLELQVQPPGNERKEIQLQIIDIKTKLQQEIEKILAKDPQNRNLLSLLPIGKEQIKSHLLQKNSLQELFNHLQNILAKQEVKELSLSMTKEGIEAFQKFLQINKLENRSLSQLQELTQTIQKTIQGLEESFQTRNVSKQELFNALQKFVQQPSLAPQQLQKEIQTLQQQLQNLGISNDAKNLAMLQEAGEKIATLLDQNAKETLQQLLQEPQMHLGKVVLPFTLEFQKEDIVHQLRHLVDKSGIATLEKLRMVVRSSQEILSKLNNDVAQLKELLQDPSKAPKELQEPIKELAQLLNDIHNELHSKEFGTVYDYTRLMSFLSHGIFVPFFWDFGKGAVSIKEREKGFLCKIYLELEEVGSVQVDLFMQKEDLLIDIKGEDPLFLEWLRMGAEELQKTLPFREVFIRFHHQEVDAKEFVAQTLQDHMVDVKI